MKILQTETLFNWGGEQNKVLNEMLLMRELGHEVGLFCNPKSEIESRAKEQGFHIITQEMSKKNYHQSVPALSKAIKDFGAELVISHGSTDSWVAAIAGLKWRKKGVKFARERHNLFAIKGFASKLAHRFLFDYIFYISASVRANLEAIKVPQNKLIFTPSIVNVNELNSAKSTMRAEFGKLSIGTFTSLYEQKGVYDLALAAKELIRQTNCDFIFGGNICDDVKARCEQILGEQAQKAVFTGFRDDAANVIKACDIFIFPSHSEGLGTALLEAMACKRAIVAYDKAPMNELIKHEERGLCAKCFEPSSLTECAMRFVNEPDFAKNCAKYAFDFVLENYDRQSLKNKLDEFLKSI